MKQHKMLFYGSVVGINTRLTYHFDRGQILSAPEGDIPESCFELVEEKRTVEVSGEKVETSSIEHKKRSKRRK